MIELVNFLKNEFAPKEKSLFQAATNREAFSSAIP